MPTSFDTYISKVEADYRKGIATEHTYRSSLENLMEALGRGIQVSNDPKHIECGAPDFIVEKGKVPLGYVETKDVGVGLDRIEKTDQMRRYLKALNNLILTDYLEFRWYVNGEKKRVVRAAEVGKGNRLLVSEQSETNIVQLFQDFYATEAPTVTSPKELAGRLAGVTHFIRDQIIAAFLQQTSEVAGRGWINPQQYFGNVPEAVWNFKVGGYQVCEKWLKDRKGRVLSGDDITHYQRVVVALKETIRLMEEIDEIIPGWPML